MTTGGRWQAAGAVALAGVFALAAAPKLAAPGEFALAIYRYQLVPAPLINLLAVYLPWLELVCAAGLLVPRWRRAAAILITLQLVVFTAAIASSLYRGLDVACGCFTLAADARHMGAWNLARNAALILLALLLVRGGGRAAASPDRAAVHRPSPPS